MRKHADLLFQVVSLATLVVALAALAALVFDIFSDGASRLSWSFLVNIASRNAEDAGVYHALMGSIWVIALTGTAGAADRRRGGDLSRGVRHRAARSPGSSSSTSPISPPCRRSSTGCSALDCSCA